MSKRMLIAGFAGESELLQAVTAVRERGWPIVEAYTPYPVHGLDHALGLRRSRLSAACLICGVFGVVLALVFQFWATGWSWPLNVGGQPWNSLPAFVPVTFEALVLFAGLGLVLAWLVRCGLYPGKVPHLPSNALTDNRFVLVLAEPAGAELAAVRHLLQSNRAVSLEEREEEAL
jgi:hypothetical protein